MKISAYYAALLESGFARWGMLKPVKRALRPLKNRFEARLVGRLEAEGPFLFPKHFDRKTRLQFLLGTYEPETTAAFKEYLKPGMTVLDIGANLGYYTWLASGLVGDQGSVFSFEPEPANYSLLLANIKKWNRHNIVPLNKAVSEHVGHATLQLSAKNGCHSLVAAVDPTGKVDVETVSIDALAEQRGLQRLDFIKIDVEGAELPAFKGMRKTLERFSPAIVFELNPKFQSQAGYTTDELVGFFKDLGYSIAYLEDETELAQKGYLNAIATKIS